MNYLKVISFSLWGNNLNYTTGAIENAKLAKYYYPDFECWFYVHIDTVPDNIIKQLETLDNVKLIKRTGNLNNIKPMMWRFEAIDEPNVIINMSRDTDTRILLREKMAVDEWIDSSYQFHIMRDHPHHMNPKTPIMGGMFGTKKITNIKLWKEFIYEIKIKPSDRYLYDTDQNLLAEFIYPKVKHISLIHSTFGALSYENNLCVKNFPINYHNDFKFVGGYIYHDGSDSKRHRDILINAIKIQLNI